MPRAKPTNLRAIDGRRPSRRIPQPPPAPEGVTFTEPRWADLLPGKAQEQARKDASRYWRTLLECLEPLGYLLPVDAYLMEEAAVCHAQLRLCQRIVAREGVVTHTDAGNVLSRYVTAANGYAQRLKVAGSELGLSPVARARLGNPKAKPAGQGASRLFS